MSGNSSRMMERLRMRMISRRLLPVAVRQGVVGGPVAAAVEAVAVGAAGGCLDGADSAEGGQGGVFVQPDAGRGSTDQFEGSRPTELRARPKPDADHTHRLNSWLVV